MGEEPKNEVWPPLPCDESEKRRCGPVTQYRPPIPSIPCEWEVVLDPPVNAVIHVSRQHYRRLMRTFEAE